MRIELRINQERDELKAQILESQTKLKRLLSSMNEQNAGNYSQEFYNITSLINALEVRYYTLAWVLC
jgi:hypothetical protein